MWQYNNELYHHGIKGQRWGIRRFQNEDGSLTEEGQKRYAKQDKLMAKYQAKINEASKRQKGWELLADQAKRDAEYYRTESHKGKPKNLYVKAMRFVTQHNLDVTARDYAWYEKSSKRDIARIMKKVGKLPYAQMDVYLADIWGLPYDVYQVHRK